MSTQKIVFLSGPISNRSDTYQTDFEEAAKAVTAAGHIPLNPAMLPFGLAERDYMRITLSMLEAADLVLLLPYWRCSKGAFVECNLAERIGIPTKPYSEFLAENHLAFADPAPEPTLTERPMSRTERMFGKKETWGQAIAPALAAPEADPEAADFERQAVRGFLIVECEECGHIRKFCSRTQITENLCKRCGHATTLNRADMRPAYAKCKCGREFKYMTNADTETLTINCIACGAPIDLQLNVRGTAYTTLRNAEQ